MNEAVKLSMIRRRITVLIKMQEDYEEILRPLTFDEKEVRDIYQQLEKALNDVLRTEANNLNNLI